MKQKTYRLCLFSMIVIVLVVGLLCYDRAGKQAQNMAGAVLWNCSYDQGYHGKQAQNMAGAVLVMEE